MQRAICKNCGQQIALKRPSPDAPLNWWHVTFNGYAQFCADGKREAEPQGKGE